eukprot:GILJ01005684.1.p1 GENE.GILJ01005684.1~~GILJ01005684.1.p1  ORF type:complete len:639 (-),score=67.64 GILJ01005684.1:44-1960(-)
MSCPTVTYGGEPIQISVHRDSILRMSEGWRLVWALLAALVFAFLYSSATLTSSMKPDRPTEVIHSAAQPAYAVPPPTTVLSSRSNIAVPSTRLRGAEEKAPTDVELIIRYPWLRAKYDDLNGKPGGHKMIKEPVPKSLPLPTSTLPHEPVPPLAQPALLPISPSTVVESSPATGSVAPPPSVVEKATSKDDQLTTVKQYVAKYPPAQGGDECEKIDLGHQYIEFLRDSATEMCTATPEVPNNEHFGNIRKEGPAFSSIKCTHHRQEYVERLCQGFNVAFDVGAMLALFDRLGDYKLTDDVDATADAVLRTCSLKPDEWSSNRFGVGAQKWLMQMNGDPNRAESVIECDEWIQEPMYFVARYGLHNLWHGFEDVTHVMEAYSAYDLPPETRMVYLEKDEARDRPGYLDDIYNRAFGRVHPIQKLHDMIKDFVARGKKRVCLARTIWSVHGGTSSMSRKRGLRSPCSASPIFLGMRDYILSSFDLQLSSLPTTAPAGGLQLSATYITRKPYKDHPHMERTLANEPEMLARLLAELPNVKVNSVDLAVIPMAEQLNVMRQTDILFGVHGAGMTHSIFLPNHAAVIELVHPERAGNWHFHNVARWTSHKYQGIPMQGSSVDVSQVVNAMKEIVNHIQSLQGK